MGRTLDRRLRMWVTAYWGRYRLGLLSVILNFIIIIIGDGLMYSQASVMPGNAGDSTALVIERSEK